MKGKLDRRLARYFCCRRIPLASGKAMVSFTFDDVPQSACIEGADILANEGGRATYYVCGGLQRKQTSGSSRFHTAEDIVTLFNMGHEIASHGYGHLNYQCLSISEIEADLDNSNLYFSDLGIPAPQNFAFPFGCVDLQAKKLCSQKFASCRGAQSAINFNEVDMALLKSVHLYASKVSQKFISCLLDRLCDKGGWLVFLSHGVTRNPGKFDIDPGMLKYALDQVLLRDIEVSTVADTVERLLAPEIRDRLTETN